MNIGYDGILYSGSPDFLGKKLTVEEQKQLLLDTADKNRDCYSPVFADDKRYAEKKPEVVGVPIKDLTTPPEKKEFPWRDALLAGVGFLLIYKLLS